MVDIQDLVETYKQKVSEAQEAESHKKEVIEPVLLQIFNENFLGVFKDIINRLNEKVNSNVINLRVEGKNRFTIEGRYHRVTFQKGKTDIIENIANANIIPLCVWRGVTKHLGPISFLRNFETEVLEWDLKASSPEEYAKKLLRKLAEDEDFYM